MKQHVAIGDGNSLRNQLAMIQMRDISDLEVKKISTKEDPPSNKPSKERQQQIK